MSRQEQNDRHIIWSDIHLNFEDWRADLEEQYPDLSEDELVQKMYEINSEYLGDERMNLNIQLSQPILVVADIGRWDGRYDGYAEIKTGNIKDCLYSEMDMCEWYVDKYGDLRADAVHHDGTNHYLYRVYKDTATDSQIENLKAKIYDGKATRADITRVTRRLGDEIAAVYGFDIPRQKKNIKRERGKNMDYRIMNPAERKYTFRQSQQISMQTGLIGYLRADFGSTGKEFYSTWNDFRKDLKTDDFKKEFDLVINSYRFGDGEFLSGRSAMSKFC